MRLAWFAAVVFVAIFGLGELAGWIGESLRGPSWWAIDLQLVLDAGNRLASSQPLYADPKFLYPPLAAVVVRPLALLDPFEISLLYAATKVALAVVAVRALTPSWRSARPRFGNRRPRLLAPVPARRHARQRERPAGRGDGGGGLRAADARGAASLLRPRGRGLRKAVACARCSSGSSYSAGVSSSGAVAARPRGDGLWPSGRRLVCVRCMGVAARRRRSIRGAVRGQPRRDGDGASALGTRRRGHRDPARARPRQARPAGRAGLGSDIGDPAPRPTPGPTPRCRSRSPCRASAAAPRPRARDRRDLADRDDASPPLLCRRHPARGACPRRVTALRGGPTGCRELRAATATRRPPRLRSPSVRGPQPAGPVLPCTIVRKPLLLFVLAVVVRALLFLHFPDPAYPDSYYYVDVARSLAAGHGFNIDFIWIFVGGRREASRPTRSCPSPANAHWMPLASIVQVPFIWLLGPTALASVAAVHRSSARSPRRWRGRSRATPGPRERVALGAGLLTAIPVLATPFMAQPDNFGLYQPLVVGALWAGGTRPAGPRPELRPGGRCSSGLATLARSDGDPGRGDAGARSSLGSLARMAKSRLAAAGDPGVGRGRLRRACSCSSPGRGSPASWRSSAASRRRSSTGKVLLHPDVRRVEQHHDPGHPGPLPGPGAGDR